jgi:HEPN domain-containing protein
MQGKEEYLALFELGRADLKLVEKNIKEKDIREQLLLFHLQQAVEKFLKALLSLHQVEFPRIHDLDELMQLCEETGITLPEYVQEFINLTPCCVLSPLSLS